MVMGGEYDEEQCLTERGSKTRMMAKLPLQHQELGSTKREEHAQASSLHVDHRFMTGCMQKSWAFCLDRSLSL
jgi:hypothetical protein